MGSMKYEWRPYEESSDVQAARDALSKITANQPGEYSSRYADQLNNTMNQILNRKDFSYDLNGDALYNQYKDQYTRQGKLAQKNAQGQAAAMTGGYGNSYAQQVGQQTYQGYLQQLNDKVPELYNLALSTYQAKGQDMQNRYNLLNNAEQTDYGRYQDTLKNWQTDRDYYTGQFNTLSASDYSRYKTETSREYKSWKEAQERAIHMVNHMLKHGQASKISQELIDLANLPKAYVKANGIGVKQKSSGGGSGGGSSGGSSGGSGSSGSSKADVVAKAINDFIGGLNTVMGATGSTIKKIP